jgi:hypothetical protein
MAQLILIIGIPNVACNGGEAGNQSGGHSKEFMYILRQTCNSHLLEDGSILSRSKTFGTSEH